MKTLIRVGAFLGLGLLSACAAKAPEPVAYAPDARAVVTSDPAIYWNQATIYFLLTDRFLNGDPSNDLALGRTREGAKLRTFQGGDLAGVLQKLEEGYFDALGVDAIWMTPFQEQNRGATDEGTGKTYAYHGYWIQDWTAVEPALGTEADLRAVVEAAHARGIRVLMDAIVNHTGPVMAEDPVWPSDWVRTAPKCEFKDYPTTVDCTLVANLPDFLTASDEAVELPVSLLDKWEREGRLDQELAELDAYFERTGHPRAPRYYLIKWLTDWVREYGFDGYRVDTAKHFEEWVGAELKVESERAFEDWRSANPDLVLDGLPFYMMGEVYNYNIKNGRVFDFGGGDTVDFFDYGYDGLINFDFADRSDESLDQFFTRYAATLEGELQGVSIINYISSHDDDTPWDAARKQPYMAGTRLLLAPGGAQIYYGDEVARPLVVAGARGDANLRSNMSWRAAEGPAYMAEILAHWRKLGQFRHAHPAVGAGEHQRLRVEPYVFSRTLEKNGFVIDRVIVAMDLDAGPKTIFVYGLFPDGTELLDAYSGKTAFVTNGEITLDTDFGLVLLSEGAVAR